MKKKVNKFFGFTLAELMVVLAVLGVISAILLPTVFDAMPDENRLKFKKGYYTLKRTIDLMVNSEAYNSTKGQFGRVKVDASDTSPYITSTDTTGSYYFCVQFTQALNTLDAQCANFALAGGTGASGTSKISEAFDASDISTHVDSKCDKTQNNNLTAANINAVTQDGISWYLPSESFFYDSSTIKDLTVSGVTYKNIPSYYATICMDVGADQPFGFGVRIDGKVVAGSRAKTMLKEGTSKLVTDDD